MEAYIWSDFSQEIYLDYYAYLNFTEKTRVA